MNVLYFAWLRTKAGVAEETLSPPADVRTVAALIEWLRSRDAAHAAALADLSVVRVAVNQRYATLEAAVAPDDEVALFPPVTGGCR